MEQGFTRNDAKFAAVVFFVSLLLFFFTYQVVIGLAKPQKVFSTSPYLSKDELAPMAAAVLGPGVMNSNGGCGCPACCAAS